MKIFTRLVLTASVYFAGAFGFIHGQVIQQGCCPNAGFDSLNFNGWTGYTGQAPNPIWTPGFNQGVNTPVNSAFQHTIMTVQGKDPNCADAQCDTAACVTFLAPGGGAASVRLGNMQVNYGAERLTYRMVVDTCNSSFTYSFAVVFQDPGTSHTVPQKPAFNALVTDTLGNVLDSVCGVYSVYAQASDPNFTSNPANCTGFDSQIRYRCWSSIGIDLTNYIGQTIELTFWTKDCGQGGHYGYAYIDATCSFLTADAAFCPNGNGQIVLVAPTGYSTYQWFDPSGNPIAAPQGTNDTCIYTGPAQVGDTFVVSLGSFVNPTCQTLLLVALVPLTISATTSSINAPCYGALGSITTSPTSGFPQWTYVWTEINTGVQVGSDTLNSIHSTTLNIGAGTYIQTLTDTLGCYYKDTITITQPPQPVDTLNQTYYFCTGDSTAALIYMPTIDQDTMFGGNYIWETYPAGAPLLTGFGTNYSLQGPNNNTLVIHHYPVDGEQFYFTWLLNGCEHKSVVTLKHQTYTPSFAPDSSANVFSPNGDGKNDVFYPYSDTHAGMPGQPYTIVNSYFDTIQYHYYDVVQYYSKDYSLKVYNRWGTLVYETTDYTLPWDGKNKSGSLCHDGVYYWISTYKNRCAPETDPPVEYKGFVHLMQ